MTQFEQAVYNLCKMICTGLESQATVQQNSANVRQDVAQKAVPVCPRHGGKTVRQGKSGYFYCCAKENDPEFGNEKGYCSHKFW